jgi:hypothetical protein
MTRLGIEPSTFQLAALCLNQLQYHMSPFGQWTMFINSVILSSITVLKRPVTMLLLLKLLKKKSEGNTMEKGNGHGLFLPPISLAHLISVWDHSNKTT